MSSEVRPGIDSTIVVFKPSSQGRELHGVEIKVAVREMLEREGLRVERRSIRRLTDHDAGKIYHTVLTRPSPFTGWQQPLKDHLTSDDVEAWLVAGDGANAKADRIKKEVRRLSGIQDPVPMRNKWAIYRERFRQWVGFKSSVNVITNLLHVTDPGYEFESGVNIFFER